MADLIVFRHGPPLVSDGLADRATRSVRGTSALAGAAGCPSLPGISPHYRGIDLVRRHGRGSVGGAAGLGRSGPEVYCPRSLDRLDPGTEIAPFASDRQQCTVPDSARMALSQFRLPYFIPELETPEPGLGTLLRTSYPAGGNLCRCGPFSGDLLPGRWLAGAGHDPGVRQARDPLRRSGPAQDLFDSASASGSPACPPTPWLRRACFVGPLFAPMQFSTKGAPVDGRREPPPPGGRRRINRFVAHPGGPPQTARRASIPW